VMSPPMVMARAYRGEPWRALLVEKTDKVAYLISPHTLSEFEAGECQPVGFPIEDVFEFDAGLYHRLREQWEREEQMEVEISDVLLNRHPHTLWRSARRYSEVSDGRP